MNTVEKINITEEILNRYKREKELKQNEARYQVGISSKYDVLRAEANNDSYFDDEKLALEYCDNCSHREPSDYRFGN